MAGDDFDLKQKWQDVEEATESRFLDTVHAHPRSAIVVSAAAGFVLALVLVALF